MTLVTGRPANDLSNPGLPIGWGRLLFAVCAVAAVWLVLLPWLARQPHMAEHLHGLEVRGIDAGAMYYTDLDMMQPILHRLERQR